MVFGHGRGDRSRSRATPAQSGRIPTHEPERRRRLSLPAARAAPPASSRPFPQPGPSPRSPSSSASPCRVLACTAADPPLVPGRVIGQKRIDQDLGRARLDAKCGMAVSRQFHRRTHFQLPRLYACFLRMRNHSLVNPTTGQFTRIPVVLTGPPPGLTNKPVSLLTVTSSPSVI